jgi:hypothetical protein
MPLQCAHPALLVDQPSCQHHPWRLWHAWDKKCWTLAFYLDVLDNWLLYRHGKAWYINGAQKTIKHDKTNGVVPASERLLVNPIFEDLQRDLDSVDEEIPSLQPWAHGTHSRCTKLTRCILTDLPRIWAERTRAWTVLSWRFDKLSNGLNQVGCSYQPRKQQRCAEMPLVGT